MIIFRYMLPILCALKRPFSSERGDFIIIVNTLSQKCVPLKAIPENAQIYKLKQIPKDELTKIGNEIPLNQVVVTSADANPIDSRTIALKRLNHFNSKRLIK